MKTKFFCSPKLSQIAFLALALTSAGAGAAALSLDINSASSSGNTQTGFDALVAPANSFANVSGTFQSIAVTVAGIGEPLASSVRATPTNIASTNGLSLSCAALYQ